MSALFKILDANLKNSDRGTRWNLIGPYFFPFCTGLASSFAWYTRVMFSDSDFPVHKYQSITGMIWLPAVLCLFCWLKVCESGFADFRMLTRLEVMNQSSRQGEMRRKETKGLFSRLIRVQKHIPTRLFSLDIMINLRTYKGNSIHLYHSMSNCNYYTTYCRSL